MCQYSKSKILICYNHPMSDELLRKLKEKFKDRVKEDLYMKDLTTVSIGGKIPAFIEAHSKEEIIDLFKVIKENNIPFFIMGGGSNLLVSDQGLDKLVIKVATSGIGLDSSILTVQAGTPLQDLVDFSINSSLEGLQRITGIPGSVAGAIYGNAGAYGQTISDHLIEVSCFDPNTLSKITLSKAQCEFDYRESGFKKNNLVILEAKFKFEQDDKDRLKKEAEETLSLRLKKYKPGIKCPGSFFKNILLDKVPKQTLAKLPPREDTFGKLPAYVFIEQLGLKGKQIGQIKIAPFHGNLFINLGEGKAQDFYNLAKECFDKTKKEFNIELEPEVILVNLPPLNS